MIEIIELSVAGLTILCAGLLKGTIGIGAPLVAVPVLATIYDVPTAIAVMTAPLLVSSFSQAWTHRGAQLDRSMLLRLLVGCAIGAVLGTALLNVVSHEWLSMVLAALVFAYVALHLASPEFVLSGEAARRVAAPVGLVIGLFQGAAGISTPVSVTFMLAQNLERSSYLLATQSIFITLGATQIIALSTMGIMNFPLASASAIAVLPMMAGIGLGELLGDHASRSTFERLTLAVLCLIALSLLYRAIPEILA